MDMEDAISIGSTIFYARIMPRNGIAYVQELKIKDNSKGTYIGVEKKPKDRW